MNARLRIGICGSASVGKTTLAQTLAYDFGLPCLEEEMRAYLVRSGANLSAMKAVDAEQVILKLWQQRRERELSTPGFVADNCAIDFAAYALYYGCMSDLSARHLLVEARSNLETYDAIVLLPWGVLTYEQDGVRPADQHLQLRYQFLLEGLLRRYVRASKLHVLPERLVRLEDRRAWVAERLATRHSITTLTSSLSRGTGDPSFASTEVAS